MKQRYHYFDFTLSTLSNQNVREAEGQANGKCDALSTVTHDRKALAWCLNSSVTIAFRWRLALTRSWNYCFIRIYES